MQQTKAYHARATLMKSKRMNIVTVLLLGISLLSTVASAGDKPRDATDEQLQRCLDDDSHGSTGDQTDCIETARKAWDTRMNRAYTQLMKALPPAAAASLRTAQRDWLVYRDAESKAQLDFYETRHGTMYVPMQANASMALIRDRAQRLEGDLEVLRIETP
jgi:uncharacterized protein YecT (DUF1311 family)